MTVTDADGHDFTEQSHDTVVSVLNSLSGAVSRSSGVAGDGPMGEVILDCPFCHVPLQFIFRRPRSRAPVRASFPVCKRLRLSVPINGPEAGPQPFWECKKCKWYTRYQPPRSNARPTDKLLMLKVLGGVLVFSLIISVIGKWTGTHGPTPGQSSAGMTVKPTRMDIATKWMTADPSWPLTTKCIDPECHQIRVESKKRGFNRQIFQDRIAGGAARMRDLKDSEIQKIVLVSGRREDVINPN
jgi:hypothetical protein